MAVLHLLLRVADECEFDLGVDMAYFAGLREDERRERLGPLLEASVKALCQYFADERRSMNNGEGKEICEFIRENYCSEDMSVNLLAGRFNMHRTLVSKLVKAETGETFSNYLSSLRMGAARRNSCALETAPRRMSASRWAFPIIPRSKRTFIRHYGCAPGNGRQKIEILERKHSFITGKIAKNRRRGGRANGESKIITI